MQENVTKTKYNIKKGSQKKNKNKNNSLKCLILNPPIDHSRDIINKIEINILKDKVNLRCLIVKYVINRKKVKVSTLREKKI